MFLSVNSGLVVVKGIDAVKSFLTFTASVGQIRLFQFFIKSFQLLCVYLDDVESENSLLFKLDETQLTIPP